MVKCWEETIRGTNKKTVFHFDDQKRDRHLVLIQNHNVLGSRNCFVHEIKKSNHVGESKQTIYLTKDQAQMLIDYLLATGQPVPKDLSSFDPQYVFPEYFSALGISTTRSIDRNPESELQTLQVVPC